MTDLAEVSGGRLLSVPTPDTMAAAFEEVLNRLRAYYLISFVPNDAPELKGQWHDVDIEVLSDNVKAHHAPRYFLGNTDPTAARSAVRDGLEQLAAEQLQPALDSFERASWADPRLAAAYYHAARVLARQGRSEDALAAFWRAWERDPGAADFQIAELSLQSGDFEAAWRHTVQAAIAGHDITALRTRLEHLSNTPDDIDQQLSVPRIFVPDGVFADPEVRPAIDDLVRAVRWATWQNTDLGLVRDIRNGDYVTKLIFNESPRPTDEHITVRFEVHDIRGAVFREDVRIGDLEDEEAVRARFADVLVAFANR